MALFKINKGNEANLPAETKEGWAYFTTDTGNFFIDIKDDASHSSHAEAISSGCRIQINANKANYVEPGAQGDVLITGDSESVWSTFFVKSTHTSSSANWTGNLPNGITSYYDGLTIDYYLAQTPTGSATLNLSGLGAKPVYVRGTTRVTTHFPIRSIMRIVYVIDSSLNSGNGAWEVLAYYDSNTYSSAYCSTSAATAGKTASCSGYILKANSYTHITMTATNTYAGAITLNINSKGAKPIYINGSASSSSNYTLPAGTYIIYYDGTNYYFRTDSKLTADITGNAATATDATYSSQVYINNDTSTKLYVLGATTTGNTSIYRESSVYMSGNVLYGAAWNDYAEYRQTKTEIAPGRVIVENGDDTLSLATERMQPGANIVSDTFGFAIGESDNCKTPIAVSGRVLAYPYEDRKSYKPGDAVCSGPNGTVSKMTREEIKEYPERIIGTVSAIPDYKYWGTGQVEVNNRIWIKVK